MPQLWPPSSERRTWQRRDRWSATAASTRSSLPGSTAKTGGEYNRPGFRSVLVAWTGVVSPMGAPCASDAPCATRRKAPTNVAIRIPNDRFLMSNFPSS
jgi:hypothetical protein